MKKRFSNRLSVFLFFISSLLMLIVAVTTSLTINSISGFLRDNIEERLLASSRAAAEIVEIEELDAFVTAADMDKPAFKELRDRLISFAEESNILYVYYIRMTPDGMAQFIIDNDTTEDSVNLSTPPIEMESSPLLAFGGIASTSGLGNYSEGYTGLLSSFAPVFDETGRVTVIAGVDIDDYYIIKTRSNMTVLTVLMLLALAGVIAGGCLSLLLYRRKERALAEALDGANRASRAKTDFLANMSHEMRTPMNAVIGMTTIARGAADVEKKDYCLKKIDEASSHLLGVINDILDMSKIEANKFELSLSEFDFEEMLKRVVNVINFRMDEKHLNFTVYVDNNIPCALIGDDQRLAQVIANLLSNAVKFTPEGGNIRLDTCFVEEKNQLCTILIKVSDTGIGVSAEQQQRLFTSFEQADSGTSRKFGGTGLGLAISKRIVEMMDGSIWVESELGEGAVFAFMISVRRGDATERRSLLPPNVNRDNLRILAVDDEADILEYFEDIMQRFGIVCDVADSGKKALELVEQNGAYDICFVDLRMPEPDGLALSRRLKALSAGKSVVIMISAAEWSMIENDAKAAGVDGFIPKPLFPSAIADCINECLGHGAMQSGASPDEAEIGCFKGYRIILAEDMEINREIVLALLEPTALCIDCAVNGEEAVRMFADSPDDYDMIFMDVQMPEMDGYEATRRIRSLNTPRAKHVPIVAMTANVFREDVEKCLDAGMDDHIGKPLDLAEVTEKLQKYLPDKA
jgi:signal transduction histidine kinase/CheY-like chemotaxis protein